MGFFSFGKKKKVDTSSSSVPATTTNSRDKKPAKLVNNASASSSLSNASSGSSSYSPPRNSQQPPLARRTNTSPAAPSNAHHRHSSALAPPPPLPALPGHGRLSSSSSTSNLRPGSHTPINLSSSSTSLAVPNAPYANGNALAKKGSSATLNSMRSVGGTPIKRGPHDPPARAVGLGSASGGSGSFNNPFNKQRAASYGYGVRNIWTTGTDLRSMDGHQYTGTHPAVFAGKHASTGSPGLVANGSSYINAHNGHHALATDNEFKAYTRKYDMTIAKAHTLAREYHHLPPARRDQAGFEKIGHAFAAAAIISREHWSMRCAMEKERLEALLSRRKNGAAVDDADWEEPSSHRIAGMRACEGWQYASMLADAWGVKEEMTMPLEEMPVLKPKRSTSDGYGRNTTSWYSDSGANYMHPGHSPAAYASYIAQQQQHPPVTRGRYDSTASRVSRASRAPSFSESVQMALEDGRERAISLSSSHTHSVVSHMPNGYASHPYPSTPHNPSPNHAHGSNHGHGSYVPSPLNRPTPGIAMTADEHGMKPYVDASHEYITPAVRGQITRSRANSETIEKVEERQPIVLKRGVKYRNGSLSGRSVEGVPIAV